jgi:hypothetical protein
MIIALDIYTRLLFLVLGVDEGSQSFQRNAHGVIPSYFAQSASQYST